MPVEREVDSFPWLLHQGWRSRYRFPPLLGVVGGVVGAAGAPGVPIAGGGDGCSPRRPASALRAALEPGGTRRSTRLKSLLAWARSPRARFAKPLSSRASE